MTITDIYTKISIKAVRRLTSHASPPRASTYVVRQWAKNPGYLKSAPQTNGLEFHRALADFLENERLVNKEYYPFLSSIRQHLRDLGLRHFRTEIRVANNHVNGRVDIIASGRSGEAVVEVKVVGSIPVSPKRRHMVQGSMGGYLSSTEGESKQLILLYVGLAPKRIRSFVWQTFREVCRRPRELGKAA